MKEPRSTSDRPAVKLGAFGVVLGLALGGGLLVGAALGPEPSTGDETSDHDAAHDDTDAVTTPDELPGGLAVSSGGYTLDLRTPVVEATDGAELALVIEGPDGRPVTDYTIEHDKELHLVIVGRDLAGYAHLHPTTRRRRRVDRRRAAADARLLPGVRRLRPRRRRAPHPWAPTSPSPATTGP